MTSALPTSPPAEPLLAWYAAHRRDLPWRAAPGIAADPYHVWLSEIMLQQTVAATVKPYFTKFLGLYPTVQALAAAPLDDVLGHWAGLGYYARARNLHAGAVAVAAGGFPASLEGLRALPGIGPYTAAAIAAIAFNRPHLGIDGNILRVAARIFAIEAPLPGAKAAIGRAAARLMEQDAARAAPGDFTQALFDLGATICTPRAPNCLICPWAERCAARARGIAPLLPRRAGKPPKPKRQANAFMLLDEAGDVLLERRPPKGLLGGMLVLPDAAPCDAAWAEAGAVRHVFTHFELTLTVHAARGQLAPDALRAPAATAPVPSLYRKALDAGLRALNH